MALIQSDEEKYFSVPSIALSKGVKEGKTRNQKNTISFVSL